MEIEKLLRVLVTLAEVGDSHIALSNSIPAGLHGPNAADDVIAAMRIIVALTESFDFTSSVEFKKKVEGKSEAFCVAKAKYERNPERRARHFEDFRCALSTCNSSNRLYSLCAPGESPKIDELILYVRRLVPWEDS